VAKTFVGIGAIIILAGAAAIGYAVTRKATGGMSPTQSSAMASATSLVDRSARNGEGGGGVFTTSGMGVGGGLGVDRSGGGTRFSGCARTGARSIWRCTARPPSSTGGRR